MRRLLPIFAGALILVGGLFGLLQLFAGRDSAGLAEQPSAQGPGVLEAESTGPPASSGPPPTSGTFAPRNVTEEGRLSPDELLTALAQGNIVIAHPGPAPPKELLRLQEEVSGPFDPELAAAGQMVVLTAWPGLDSVQGLAWRRRLEAAGPDDPKLRAFAEAWLGQGRGNTG